jgi:hypothetical protein
LFRDKNFGEEIVMKVKIIKRMELQTVTTANSGTSHKLKEDGAGKTIAATVKSWIDELKRKSEVNTALMEKLFKTENSSKS